jgi:hypothetical protein
MMIAIRSLPIDTCASTARITPSALGGIMIARPPLPTIGPMIIVFL